MGCTDGELSGVDRLRVLYKGPVHSGEQHSGDFSQYLAQLGGSEASISELTRIFVSRVEQKRQKSFGRHGAPRGVSSADYCPLAGDFGMRWMVWVDEKLSDADDRDLGQRQSAVFLWGAIANYDESDFGGMFREYPSAFDANELDKHFFLGALWFRGTERYRHLRPECSGACIWVDTGRAVFYLSSAIGA